MGQLLPIAGLVAFYNEKVDIFLSGPRLERPKTHFFASADGRLTRAAGSSAVRRRPWI